jgi:excisionase family DNA binding protein
VPRARKAAHPPTTARYPEVSTCETDGVRLRRLLRVTQVAEYADCSERTVWRWIADGLLPAKKIKGITRIDPVDLGRLLGVSGEDFADDDECEEDDGTDRSEN